MASQTPSTPVESDVILTLSNNITIRRYRPTDAPSLYHHGNSKKIWDNLRNRMPHPYTETDASFWIQHSQSPAMQALSDLYGAIPTQYCICINGGACGSIGLDFGDAADIYARTAEIGYWLGVQHWGKGVMGIAVPAFVEWTWRTFSTVLMRLNAEVSEANVGSRKVLEKAGFVVEGRRKWAFVKNGAVGDSVFLGMLRPGVEEDNGESKES
ncbi:hypothetical protein LTR37_012747 [Vermiconidia calcicola]|uniref:Uncharacterized protein n=1 Tax=Vermiconidia calcicola TaxID=1690605 RepID=A0ACC3MZX3_9PEZI|nr:hypothetical protein LTR37_012747 [Vermiconidia calcicola]